MPHRLRVTSPSELLEPDEASDRKPRGEQRIHVRVEVALRLRLAKQRDLTGKEIDDEDAATVKSEREAEPRGGGPDRRWIPSFQPSSRSSEAR